MSKTLPAEYRRLWLEAMLLPGESDAVESCLKELAEYTGLSPEEVHVRCLKAVDDQRALWFAKERASEAQLTDFYNECDAYLYELLWWHALQQGEAPAWNAHMVALARRGQARSYLDFGAGIGTNAILLSQLGLEVTVADVSDVLLDFARWRFKRRQLEVRTIDLKRDNVESGRYDLVSAVDVLEHVHDPVATLQTLNGALRLGGHLVFDLIASKQDSERPFHLLRSKYPIRSTIRGMGFQFVEKYQKFLVYRKVKRSVAANRMIRAWDQLRWRLYYLLQGKWPPASGR